MDIRWIGSLEVSIVGVGCNNFGARIDEARTKEVIDAALDAGVNFFDTADVYADGGSEENIARKCQRDLGFPADADRLGRFTDTGERVWPPQAEVLQ